MRPLLTNNYAWVFFGLVKAVDVGDTCWVACLLYLPTLLLVRAPVFEFAAVVWLQAVPTSAQPLKMIIPVRCFTCGKVSDPSAPSGRWPICCCWCGC